MRIYREPEIDAAASRDDLCGDLVILTCESVDVP